MIFVLNMRKVLILIVVILSSCNSKQDSNKLCDVSFSMIIKDNSKLNVYLNENIKSKVEKNKNNKNIRRYDSLTKIY
jgi:hypothetical protein